MSSLYLRGKKAYVGYTDAIGRRKNVPTGLTVDPVIRRGRRVVWPRIVLDFQKQLDRSLADKRFGFGPTLVSSVGVSAALERYLQTLTRRHRMRAPGTVKNYRLAVEKLTEHFGAEVRMAAVSEEMAMDLRNALIVKYGDQTAAMFLRHLSGLFSWAQKARLIQISPFTGDVKLKPLRRPIMTFSEVELDAIRSVLIGEMSEALVSLVVSHNLNQKALEALKKRADPDLLFHIDAALLTGIRSGDLCSLKWSNVQLKDGIIRYLNRKAGEWETYPIDKVLAEFIGRVPHAWEPFVFRYRHPSTIAHRLKRILRLLKLDERLNAHCLKKTYVTRLVQSPALSSAFTHKLSHHASLETTLGYYAQFNVDALREALAKSRQ